MDIFVDRDGDKLVVVPRSKLNPMPDPIISVSRKISGHDISQSVIFTDDEAPKIVINLIAALDLNKKQINEIYEWLTAVHVAVNSR